MELLRKGLYIFMLLKSFIILCLDSSYLTVNQMFRLASLMEWISLSLAAKQLIAFLPNFNFPVVFSNVPNIIDGGEGGRINYNFRILWAIFQLKSLSVRPSVPFNSETVADMEIF